MQTALNQQTNMMLEVQNFDHQPQHASTEASSRPQQAPFADVVALNPQLVGFSTFQGLRLSMSFLECNSLRLAMLYSFMAASIPRQAPLCGRL